MLPVCAPIDRMEMSHADRLWLLEWSSRSPISREDTGKASPAEGAPPAGQARIFRMQAEVFSVSPRDAELLASIQDRGRLGAWSLSNGEASQDALRRFAAMSAKRSLGSVEIATPFNVETRDANRPVGDLTLSITCIPALGPYGSEIDLALNMEFRDLQGNAIGHAGSRIIMSEPGQRYLIAPTLTAGNRQRRDAILILVTYIQ